MSESAGDFAYRRVTDDRPELRARRRHLFQLILESDPDLVQPFEDKGRLIQARSNLRRILARRGLAVRPEDDARIDACSEIATVRRWIDEAIVAKTAADVFGVPAKKPRAAPKRRVR